MNSKDIPMAGEPGSAGSMSEHGEEVYEKARQTAGEVYQKTTEAVGEAYEKTSRAVTGAYEEAVSYGRENPAMMTLIAFGIGVGVGLLLASSMRRPRYGGFAEPLIGAFQDFARDYLRY
ncbi:MAG: hypothetical protein QME75_00020 [Deltaproteobacteria bacterium]|nr:hypothetical protein [Deltaproteobacteria bacterium]